MCTYESAFSKAIYRVRGARRHHIRIKGQTARANMKIERLNSSIREREKVVRAFKNPETAKKILGGWSVYYNFIRPHESLDGLTPAEASGINLELNGGNRWLELIKVINENNGGINGKPKLGENNKGSFLA